MQREKLRNSWGKRNISGEGREGESDGKRRGEERREEL